MYKTGMHKNNIMYTYDGSWNVSINHYSDNKQGHTSSKMWIRT